MSNEKENPLVVNVGAGSNGAGILFSMGHRDGGSVGLAYPLYSCKDYLNDCLVAHRRTNSDPYLSLTIKKCLDLDREVMVVVRAAGKDCTFNETERKRNAANYNYVTKRYKAIQLVINDLEAQIGIDGRTDVKLGNIAASDDMCLLVFAPTYWSRATYLMSLLALTIRVAIRQRCAPATTWNELMASDIKDGNDEAYAKSAIAKLPIICGWPKGEIAEQTFNTTYFPDTLAGDAPRSCYWHSAGIHEAKLPVTLKTKTPNGP